MPLRACSPIVGRCAAALLVLLTGAFAHAQLVPPPGPVAPSMKRLDQLDARKLITRLPGSSSALHVISEPGQYMLDRDIDCPSGKSAIVVTACGDVSIDLNGFSMRGASGALDGVSRAGGCGGGGGGGSGGSLQVFSSKRGYDYYQAQSQLTGFARGIATGDLDGDGLEDLVIAGLSISSCGQGIVHLHATNIVHRDLACRSITGGDAIRVQFDEPSAIPGGPRQSTSMDSSRCSVDGATGRGMHVACSSGTRITIEGSNFRNTGAQGLHVASTRGVVLTVIGSNFDNTGSHAVHVQQGGVVPVNDPPLAVVSECSMTACAGAAVRYEGSSGQATGKRQHGVIRSVIATDCVSALEATDCDDLDCTRLSSSNSSGDGVVCRRVGRPKFENISVSRCPSTGAAVRIEDCDDVSCVRVAVGDVTGDGILCSGVPAPTGVSRGKMHFEDISIVAPRDPPSGQATGKRSFSASHSYMFRLERCAVTGFDGDAVVLDHLGSTRLSAIDVSACRGRGLVVRDCDDVSCVRVAVGDVNGDAIAMERCPSVSLHASRVSGGTCATGDCSAVSFTDCDSTDCNDLSITGCPGHGISHLATISNTPGTRGRLLAHEAVHVVQQRAGSGVRVLCPDQLSSTEVSFSRCSIGSCAADGVAVRCLSPLSGLTMRAVQGTFRDCAGNGVSVVANPASPVSVTLEGSTCSGNGGNGLSVVSSVQGQSLRGGGEVRCTCSHFRSNGASGCVSDNPLYADQSSFSNNPLYGARVYSDDPFRQIASLDSCVLQGNGAACLSVPRGRFSAVDCRVSDGLGNGIESGEGCALLTNTQVQRCAGMGIVTSSSTLYMFGGAVRRNGGAGIMCTGGSFDARDLTVELNGSTSPVGTPNGGLRIVDCPVVSMERCVVSQNTGDGVNGSSAAEAASWSSSRCTFSGNTGHGLALSNCPAVVTDCVSSSNGGTGVSLSSTCSRGQVVRCVCKDNFTGGMRVLGTRNVVSGNSATGSAVAPAFEIAQGNAACPVVDPSSGAPACGATDNVVH